MRHRQHSKVKIKVVVLISLAIASFSIAYIYRGTFAPLADVFEEEFDTTSTGIGLLSSVIYASYALMQIPVGLMLQIFTPEIILFVTFIGVAITSVLFAMTDNLCSATIINIVVGVFIAPAFITVVSITTHRINADSVQFVAGINLFVSVICVMIGTTVEAQLYMDFKIWRTFFFFIGGASFLCAIFVFAITLLCFARDYKNDSCIDDGHNGNGNGNGNDNDSPIIACNDYEEVRDGNSDEISSSNGANANRSTKTKTNAVDNSNNNAIMHSLEIESNMHNNNNNNNKWWGSLCEPEVNDSTDMHLPLVNHYLNKHQNKNSLCECECTVSWRAIIFDAAFLASSAKNKQLTNTTTRVRKNTTTAILDEIFANSWRSLKLSFSNRLNWFLGIVGFCQLAVTLSLNGLWLILYLMQKFNYSRSFATFVTNLYLLFYGIGSICFGRMAMKYGKRKIFFIAGLFLTLSSAILIYGLTDTGTATSTTTNTIVVIAVNIVSGFGAGSNCILFTLVGEYNAHYKCGDVAAGFVNGIQTSTGFVIQYLIGAMLDYHWQYMRGGNDFRHKNGHKTRNYSVSDFDFAFLCIPIGLVVAMAIAIVFIKETNAQHLKY